VIATISCGLVGFSVLSFTLLAGWHPLAAIGFSDATAFALLDGFTWNLLLPVDSLALALFGGWAISPALFCDELEFGAVGTACLRALLRYIAPRAIAAASVAAVRF
jgi:SNF family Na+-dependent transporter